MADEQKYYMATPGMIANSLRPIVLAHGDGTPPPAVTVPSGTLSTAYLHLERLAAALGDETDGHRAWAEHGNPVDRRPLATLDVAKERLRQMNDEGWTPEHDDEHDEGDLAKAAACYAAPFAVFWPTPETERRGVSTDAKLYWPWEPQWWKPALVPGDRRRQLVKAGALIIAEIERLDRAAAREQAAA